MCGTHFSLADCAVIPAMCHAQVAAPFDTFPNVAAYWRRAQQRASDAKVTAEFEPVWNGMMAMGAA